MDGQSEPLSRDLGRDDCLFTNFHAGSPGVGLGADADRRRSVPGSRANSTLQLTAPFCRLLEVLPLVCILVNKESASIYLASTHPHECWLTGSLLYL